MSHSDSYIDSDSNDRIPKNETTMTNWFEKYCPKTSKEVIGNKDKIRRLKLWLNSYEENKKKQLANPKRKRTKKSKKPIDTELSETKIDDIPENIDKLDDFNYDKKKKPDEECSCSLVLGKHGVGKTCSVLSVLNDLKYDITVINLSKICSLKKIEEFVERITKGKNILNSINEIQHNKNALVIDDIGNVTSLVEKTFITTILKYNDMHWECPIIFISNNKHTKVLTTLKSNTCKFNFDNPTRDSLMEMLIKVATNEGMKFEDQDVGFKIIEHSQNDYRRLLQILQNLKATYGNEISKTNIEEYCSITSQKDVDIDIWNALARLMTTYKNIDECMRIFDGEKTLTPLMMDENYTQYLNKFMYNDKKALEIANRISESISMGDFMESYMFNSQNWALQDIHGFYTCVVPSYELTHCGIEKLPYDVLIDRETLCDFANDLNRSSIKQINKKNITNSNMFLKNFSIDDFLKLNTLIQKLISDNKIKECVELFEGYNVKRDNIMSILKIDKITDKITMNTSVKNEISNLLNDDTKTKTKKNKQQKSNKIKK